MGRHQRERGETDYTWVRELTDGQWRSIEPLLKRQNVRGRPHRDSRNVLNGILWVLGTGAPWRDLPPKYGPWQTAYTRYRIWSREGSMYRILELMKGDP